MTLQSGVLRVDWTLVKRSTTNKREVSTRAGIYVALAPRARCTAAPLHCCTAATRAAPWPQVELLELVEAVALEMAQIDQLQGELAKAQEANMVRRAPAVAGRVRICAPRPHPSFCSRVCRLQFGMGFLATHCTKMGQGVAGQNSDPDTASKASSNLRTSPGCPQR